MHTPGPKRCNKTIFSFRNYIHASNYIYTKIAKGWVIKLSMGAVGIVIITDGHVVIAVIVGT